MPRPPLFERVNPTEPTNSQYNINYRQVAAQSPAPAAISIPQLVTTSSSYDYWWPFPPGGVATTSSSPSLSVLSSPTLIDTLSVATLSSSDFSSINYLASSGIPSTSVPTSSSAVSTSQSIISINASMTSQSASSTFSSNPEMSQKAQSQSFNTSKTDAYLIPILVVLGVVVGSVVAWFGWGCLTRKPRVRDYGDGDEEISIGKKKKAGRRSRRRELQVGPVYCPSLSERAQYLEEFSGDSPEKAVSPKSVFSWRALDTDGGRSDESERDYLVPPALPVPKKSRTKSVASKRQPSGLSRATTTKTATSVSVYSQVEEEDEDEHYEEVENDRMSFLNEFESDYDPRSPRFGDKLAAPGIATPTNSSSSSNRVISVSRRRPNHIRADSDLHLVGGAADDEIHVDSERDRKGDLRRSATSRTQSSILTAQTGFRMIDGSPLPTPAGAGSAGGFFWGNNEPEERHGKTAISTSAKSKRGRSKPITAVNSSDSYTSLPVRGSRSRSNSPTKKRSVVSRQITKQRQVSARDKAIEEYYGNSFPQSPPQITSPQLHSSLCFTPPLN